MRRAGTIVPALRPFIAVGFAQPVKRGCAACRFGVAAAQRAIVRVEVTFRPRESTATVRSVCLPALRARPLTLSVNLLFVVLMTRLPSSVTVTLRMPAAAFTLILTLKARDTQARRTPATASLGSAGV